MVDIRPLIPIVKELLSVIIAETKSGRLHFNMGSSGIFVEYQSNADAQPLRIEIPFQQHNLEPSQV